MGHGVDQFRPPANSARDQSRAALRCTCGQRGAAGEGRGGGMSLSRHCLHTQACLPLTAECVAGEIRPQAPTGPPGRWSNRHMHCDGGGTTGTCTVMEVEQQAHAL